MHLTVTTNSWANENLCRNPLPRVAWGWEFQQKRKLLGDMPNDAEATTFGFFVLDINNRNSSGAPTIGRARPLLLDRTERKIIIENMITFGHTNSSLEPRLFLYHSIIDTKLIKPDFAGFANFQILDHKSISDVSTCCFTGTNDLYHL